MKADIDDKSLPGAGEDQGSLLDIMAKVHVSLGRIETALASRQRALATIHPISIGQIPMSISAGSGGLDQPDIFGPHTGYTWDVHTVIASGFSAGSVTMYTGGTPLAVAAGGQGNVEFVFSQAGQLTYGKGQLLMMAGDRLTFEGTGVTGQVNIKVRAVEMEVWALPEYLI